MSSGNLPGVSVKDVDQQKFVKALAAFFKKAGKIKMIENADIIKLGSYKEMAPDDIDWFYTRTAAIARHLYIRSPVGVGALTYMYGGRQNNGTTPSHFVFGSASVARKALQALESLKMVEKDPNGGRKLTSTGRRDLDRIATQLKANKQ